MLIDASAVRTHDAKNALERRFCHFVLCLDVP